MTSCGESQTAKTDRRREARSELARRELARRHLLDWCSYVDSGFMAPPHVRLLASKLEAIERGELTRLIVAMPPRHGKSEMVSLKFPPWYVGRQPKRRVILASYADDLARGFSRSGRDLLAEYGRQLFGVSVSPSSAAANRWNLHGYRGGMMSAGVGGSITGKGADLFVIDDPFKDRQEADSETIRAHRWSWFQEVARTRLEPGAAMVVMATRWHEDDISGRLIDANSKGEQNWEVLNLPAVAGAGDPLGRAPGQALWPERYDEGSLAELKTAVGTRGWLALYQQQPTSASGNIFKRDWFQRYHREDLPRKWEQLVISWDCSFKDERESKSGEPDFVVGQVWGCKGPRRYLLEQVRAQMGFTTTVRSVRDLHQAWPRATAILVEDKANGTAVMNTLKSTVPGIVAVEPEGGKIARANACAPLVEAGNVWLPLDADAPWVEGFMDECCGFPRKKNDDQVDAMTQALNYLHSDAGWLAALAKG